MTTNKVAKAKQEQDGPLTRADIAEVLASIGEPGELRERKEQVIRDLCENKPGAHSYGYGGHPVWDTLADWQEF